MAENTKQFRWIATIQGNLDAKFAHLKNVLVAGDNLIYAKKGDPTVRTAPDVYVAIGRPKGDRGSYQVWLEDDLFPQVVFEVLSPGNRAAEQARKFEFYETYGVEEYYIYDPDSNKLEGYIRESDRLVAIPQMDGWISPRLDIVFDLSSDPELVIRHLDGKPFLTFVEQCQVTTNALLKYEIERKNVIAERQRTEEERKRAEEERKKATDAMADVQRLKAMLAKAGIDPESMPRT